MFGEGIRLTYEYTFLKSKLRTAVEKQHVVMRCMSSDANQIYIMQYAANIHGINHKYKVSSQSIYTNRELSGVCWNKVESLIIILTIDYCETQTSNQDYPVDIFEIFHSDLDRLYILCTDFMGVYI